LKNTAICDRPLTGGIIRGMARVILQLMTQSISLPQSTASDSFAARLAADGQSLIRASLTTLQLNLGKMCNIACHHCHVEAGPDRTEIMSWETMRRILDWLDRHQHEAGIEIVDLTGGSPEMNPDFKRLVIALKQRGLHLLDRCNPTILNEPGYEDMAEFLAEHEVEIVASLPCYLEDNVDAQRGSGVFQRSIEALKKLNSLGYGGGKDEETDRRRDGKTEPGSVSTRLAARASGRSMLVETGETPVPPEKAGVLRRNLTLDLVYNPVGYGLPPAQVDLESAYKKHLKERYGITFNSLWTITNMPIKRFEHALRRDGKLDHYMDKLTDAHNDQNVGAVMCRSLVSIGWRGAVYDCDFNQMLQMTIESESTGMTSGKAGRTTATGTGLPEALDARQVERQVESAGRKLWDFTPGELIGRPIRTAAHCFGCTAGAGSSCTGALS